MGTASSGCGSRTNSASQTILVGLLLVFVLANLTQVVVVDLNQLHLPSSLPSKLEFLGNHRGDEGPHHKAENSLSVHQVAGLTCQKHGGPASEDAVNEMVYWRDIPQDAAFVSPLRADEEQYLTFEPGRV